MTDTFNEGDLIEATYKDTLIRGRLTGLGQMPGVCRSPESLALDGYTIRTIEKAAPALPTENGWYRSSGLGADRVDGLLHLSARGDWTWVGNMFAVNPDHLTDKQARLHLPLNRLEPVADTAKKVAEKVRQLRAGFIDATNADDILTLCGDIETHFGVTS